ncbi:diacylglycerol/lipid kinase family protein [Dyadobacter psychrophilus]|uniref:Lipid kinase, YegS/Rv2252/BmrU family n=1 Tax=Dyadobacter psychrophilus TaxID=651661 RepID=A0A1T5FET3_9BACT|nr:diacylglycerol kinase family protein [Dyadobacter psychrophilus]SKB94689.1 lipid kinase, YegS/Rv2252/BmrU family [Dyadobacter psychrophilus]
MFSERKVLLVVNPISGDVNKDVVFEEVIETAAAKGYDLRIYTTTGEHDLETIREMVGNIKPERVLVAGGDGTISLTAEAVQGSDVIMGVIPVGSANGLAMDFGITGSITEAVEVAFGDKIIGIDAVCINNEVSLHLSDIGLNALLVKNYESSDTRGKLGYAREMLKTLSEHENFLVKITTANEVIETEALIVIIANAQKYGTGVTINPTGDMSDGFFELVIAKKLDFIETAKILAGSTDFNPEIMRVISVEKADIECLDKEAHFQIDGEYKGMVRNLEAHILKDYIKVAIP